MSERSQLQEVRVTTNALQEGGDSGSAAVGLSIPHISPRPMLRTPSAHDAPSRPAFCVEVATGATYMRLVGDRRGPANGGGMRGDVCGFSPASRKRLRDRLNQVPVDMMSAALFVTLTFPDEFPTIPTSKRMLDKFLKRLRRAFPRCSGVWRMERVPRLSGSHVGELAPHYHLLLFAVPWMETEWLARAWYECVGSGDERHFRAGTGVQRVRSRRGVMYYASKYMSKLDGNADGAHTGRVWAVFGVAWLDVEVRRYELSRSQFYQLRRVLRSWVLKRWKRGGARAAWGRGRGMGLTAYLSEADALRLLSWAADS